MQITEIGIFPPKKKQITKKYERLRKQPKDNTPNIHKISKPNIR